MIRAVLFDLDGTLVDYAAMEKAELFRAGASRCYAYLSAHELPLPSFDVFLRKQRWIHRTHSWLTWLGGGEPDGRRALRRLCRDYGLQRDHASLARLGWLWYEPLTHDAQVAADVVPTLSALCNAGVELGLVANTSFQGAVIDQHLEDLGLLEFFPSRAYSTEVGAHKPDPRLFEAAMTPLGISAAETIVVGDDAKADMLGAKRMGMTTVLRRPDGDNVADVPAADHVIQHIGQLLDLPELNHVRSRMRVAAPAIPALIV